MNDEPTVSEWLSRSRVVLLVNDSIEEVQYTETDHYLTTKSFVNDHVNMLKRLLEQDVL